MGNYVPYLRERHGSGSQPPWDRLASSHVCFFFLMIRRPPRSTLFPYTDALPISSLDVTFFAFDFNSSSTVLTARSTPRLRDRKSTRLNSSHVAISYAVFCLKKKKKKIERQKMKEKKKKKKEKKKTKIEK